MAELATWVRRHRLYPTRNELLQAGLGTLRSARDRLWAGVQDELREAVGRSAGLALPPRRAASGSLATPEQLAEVLRPLTVKLGRMPTAEEAASAGLGTAWARASRTMGVDAMAARIGVPGHLPRRRSRAEMMAAFLRLSLSLGGAKLTTTAVRKALGSGGIAWLRKCGGISAVREELGHVGIGSGQGG